ncbi:GNAT family N-acetyltransferase [Bizionia argentinensis JUB59]|uniref:GNAT family N-acetyltransferase n=1 Tax=Bizionia argentinensis JUB59 TaxID=1046627 RepID=G2EH09_9FLAO|nr:GNAT family N-acetyltransferase [Bizionia argentinensis]EGV42131.2 GNAT family N-acetyltransferase [Bizionia argentinensis JUB59]
MIIRQARPEDFKAIATYMLLAMNDIVYQFIGEDSPEKATQFLENLIQKKGNQYSYENCWVAENDGEIIAAATIYDGAKLEELRTPVVTTIKTMFNRYFNSEDETQPGEFYIDCVGVNPNQQGQGVGSKLFQFLIDEYVYNRKKTLGLLVDKDNPNAKRLYLNLGFKVVGEKKLTGKTLEHLQFKK